MIIHGIRSGKSVIGKLFEVKLCNINQACNLKSTFHKHAFVLDRFRKHTQITVLINATSQNYCQNRKYKWVLQMCCDKLNFAMTHWEQEPCYGKPFWST